MGNHVIYDRLWESKKLAQCARDAAMAYPWIFLVADDHGRFEYNPLRIASKVFGNRRDVSVEEVTGWLEEYWRVGLMKRYHLDGELAVWYKFKGRKPSERRPSDYPEPDEFPALEWKPRQIAAPPAKDRAPLREVPLPEPRQIVARAEIEQSGDRAEQNSAPAAPGGRPEASLVQVMSWNRDASAAWIEVHGGKPQGAMMAALKRIVKRYPWNRISPTLRYYLATKSLDYLNWDKFESGFETIEAEASGAPARASPKLMQTIRAAKEFSEEGEGD